MPEKIDVDKLSKRRILKMFQDATDRAIYLEARLYFFNPEDKYFEQFSDEDKQQIHENALKFEEKYGKE